MLPYLMLAISFLGFIVGFVRIQLLSDKNLTLTAVIFFLATSIFLRQPIFFSQKNTAIAGLIAHIIYLIAITLTFELSYLLQQTPDLLDNKKILKKLYHYRIPFCLAAILILVFSFVKKTDNLLIEFSLTPNMKLYWITFALSCIVSSITILVATKNFEISSNKHVHFCFISIKIFSYALLYYGITKILTVVFFNDLNSISKNIIEWNSAISVGGASIFLTISGVLPVIDNLKRKNGHKTFRS